MIVFIVRHAEAQEKGEGLVDEWRHLVSRGRDAAAWIARRINRSGPKVRLTVTSPLPRAVQTAEICARHACRHNRVLTSTCLLPGSDPAEAVAYLDGLKEPGPVMLVGHEPHLGALAARLLAVHQVITLKKGACLALKCGAAGEPAEFLWYRVPGKKPEKSLKKAFKTS